ncbi:RNase P modulator RnpM [Chloroflexota bacterium]
MKIKQSGFSIKHIPQRTCVACRKVRPKRELIRLVRIAEGNVYLDSTGKIAGRGAYLCPSQGCLEIGLSGGRLEHALHTNINQDNRERLISDTMKIGCN